ncbi:hypothetical protein V1522DRAFT_415197, partial [Lipomyces starkeyi]
ALQVQTVLRNKLRLLKSHQNPLAQNLSLWSPFSISYLSGKLWKIRCTMCNWKMTDDSARATSTRNMKLHLNRHGIPSDGGDDHGGDEGRMRQQSVATICRESVKDDVAKTLEQNCIPTEFNNLPGVSLPFTCPQTVARRIDSEFTLCRAQL